MGNSVFFINALSMLVGLASKDKSELFYCYNEESFRVKGRNYQDSLKVVEVISKILELELTLLDPKERKINFVQGDAIDPFLLSTSKILPGGQVKPNLIGWNADLYLKFANTLNFSHPFKSHRVVKGWKKAECFRHYSELILHPSISRKGSIERNYIPIDRSYWDFLIEKISSHEFFQELYFNKYEKQKRSLLIFPHPTNAKINSNLVKLAENLTNLGDIQQVIIKYHPNTMAKEMVFPKFKNSSNLLISNFETKELPSEFLIHYFKNSYTLGVPSGSHVQASPQRTFIFDCSNDPGSELWNLYYSKFYQMTGHQIQSGKKLLQRINLIGVEF